MSFFLGLLGGCPNPSAELNQDASASESTGAAPSNSTVTSQQQSAIDEAKSEASAVLQDGCSFVVNNGSETAYRTELRPSNGYNNNPDWAYCNQKLNSFRASVTDQLSSSRDVACERSTTVSMDGEKTTLIETCTVEPKPEEVKK